MGPILTELFVKRAFPLLDARAGVRVHAQSDVAALRQVLQHARCLLHIFSVAAVQVQAAARGRSSGWRVPEREACPEEVECRVGSMLTSTRAEQAGTAPPHHQTTRDAAPGG